MNISRKTFLVLTLAAATTLLASQVIAQGSGGSSGGSGSGGSSGSGSASGSSGSGTGSTTSGGGAGSGMSGGTSTGAHGSMGGTTGMESGTNSTNKGATTVTDINGNQTGTRGGPVNTILPSGMGSYTYYSTANTYYSPGSKTWYYQRDGQWHSTTARPTGNLGKGRTVRLQGEAHTSGSTNR